jgi:hypothetical protein
LCWSNTSEPIHKTVFGFGFLPEKPCGPCW